MGRINVLGFDVANLIAAGEVVDRPSSIVKELLENSIDAGADAVTVEIQRGGVAFIRISDNGCGMEPEDLPVAILRHATSKISGADDLSRISTLGFRGEALAAISSVSRMRIFSRPHGSSEGAMLTADGGEVVDITETGCAEGTTVVVEELFYNVPARRKFLKKDATEAAAVGALVERIALSRPDISIKYICDGALKFYTQGDGRLTSAIHTVFGRDVSSRMIKVDRSAEGISVAGFTSEPDLIKSNRNTENFFVNGRYVKSKTVMAAVEQAYRARIPADKFPFCVLNIDLNPAAVDVNVHPAKLEIKFSNEKIIFDAVYYAVINALESTVVRPELNIFPKRKNPTESISCASDIRTNNSVPSRVIASVGAKTQIKEKGANLQPEAGRYGASTEKIEETSDPRERIKKSDFWIDGKEARRLLGAFVPADSKEKLPEQTKIRFDDNECEKTSGGAINFPSETFSERDASPAKDADHRAERQYETAREKEFALKTLPASETSGSLKTGDDAGDSLKSSCAMSAASSEAPVKTTIDAAESAGNISHKKDFKASEESGDYVILGEAYNTYVILQLEDRLLFVDKHAAHERIIFDELKRKMKETERGGQILMIPRRLTVLEIEAAALEEYGDRVRSLGFEFFTERDGAAVKVNVTQIPDMLSCDEAVELMSSLISQLSDVGAGVEAAAEEFFEARLFQASCKAAVKGGRIYDRAHIKWICDRLIERPGEDGAVIRTCPHGRPVAFEVKKSSIDRQFARIG